MREPNHYVPILKSKQADLWAMTHLKDEERGFITPLFEIVPPGKNAKTEKLTQVERHGAKCAEACMGKRFFADLLYFEGSPPKRPTDPHWVKAFFDKARENDGLAVPVTSSVRSPQYQKAVKAVVAKDRRGLMIRLSAEQVADEDAVKKNIGPVMTFHQVDFNEVDLLIDLGSVHNVPEGTLKAMYKAVLATIPKAKRWRSITIASSAFPTPDHMSKSFEKDAWNGIERKEWAAWNSLYRSRAKLDRCPCFSDYTVGDPDLPVVDAPGYTVSLRYSDQEYFMVWRGQLAKMYADGNGQMRKVCKDLIKQPFFAGDDFSAGDHEMFVRATTKGSPGPGNASSWRQWAASHYLAVVADGIASLPAP